MARQIPKLELQAIENIVNNRESGIKIEDIERELGMSLPRRTLNNRIKYLVSNGRLVQKGTKRWTTYFPAHRNSIKVIASETQLAEQGDLFVPLSKEGAKIKAYVSLPLGARKHVGYERRFLDAYIPNETSYLSSKEKALLRKVGTPNIGAQPAGTYAKQLLARLLIDLSWNSSRLEGNTYSLLDTKRLIDLGQEAEGKERQEAQMIINHKEAIEFLVDAAADISFNRYTLLNLHAILSNNLLSDSSASGRLRSIPGSVYQAYLSYYILKIGGIFYPQPGAGWCCNSTYKTYIGHIESI